MTGFVDAASNGWIAVQEGIEQAALADTARQIEQEICQRAGKLVGEIVARRRAAETATEWRGAMDPYCRRVWGAVAYHWQRLGAEKPRTFLEVVERIEAGDLGAQRIQGNLLADVVLAQALELNESRAADMFETDYMPSVQATALRVSGPRGLEAVENFAAELILPRDDRPPRISQYRGRTSLACWLRAVVTNYCVGRFRGRQLVTESEQMEPSIVHDPGCGVDLRRCEGMLRPMFADAMGRLAAEDRLLLKLLVLDEVPQKDLARSLGINPGNVTRRKQRAAAAVWLEVKELAQAGDQVSAVHECLQLVLAGDDPQLRRQLGGLLADGLEGPQ